MSHRQNSNWGEHSYCRLSVSAFFWLKATVNPAVKINVVLFAMLSVCSEKNQGAWKFQAASPTCIASIPGIRCKVTCTSMGFFTPKWCNPFVSVAISKARQSSQSSHSQTSKYLVSPTVKRQSPVNNPPASPASCNMVWSTATPRYGRTFGHHLSDVHSILLHFLASV